MTRKKKARGQNVTRTKTSETKMAGKWLLAVDPFSGLDLKNVTGFIRAAAYGAEDRLLGAYLLAPQAFNWTGDFSGPWLKRYKPVAEAKAAELGRALNLDIEVVPVRKPGLKHSVEMLVKYATKIKAECIVVSTHGRHGLDRWVLGSFAESVLLVSKIPVLAVNPTQKMPQAIRKIFVPTDLTAQSTKFVLKVAEFAQRTGAALDLFFRQPDPLDPMIQQGVYAVGGGWVSVDNYLEDTAREEREKLDKLCEGLRKRGLKVSSVAAVAHGSSSLVSAIESNAQERGADLIAVLTQSGPVAATLLGSVARGLVRTSPIPVMVFR